MAIDPATPFTRINWNEDIIQRVNDLCENPDSGCDSLPLLVKVDPKHRWSKTDIQEVEDKLLEICPNNTFSDTPEKWSYSETIVPIENAIEEGWCECVEVPSEQHYDLGFWDTEHLDARRGVDAQTSATLCGTLVYDHGGDWYPAVNNSPIIVAIRAQYSIINTQRTIYGAASYEIFDLEDEIIQLESDISLLNSQIESLESTIDVVCTADPESTTCRTAQAELIEKEAELAEKEAELAEKEAELAEKILIRDAARVLWDTAAQTQWALFSTITLRYPTDISPIQDLFPEMSEPWGDYFEDTRGTDKPKWKYYCNISGRTFTNTGYFSPSGYSYVSNTTQILWFLNVTCKHTTHTTTCPDCDCFAWQINSTHCCGGSTDTPNCCEGILVNLTWDYIFGIPSTIWWDYPTPNGDENCSYLNTYGLSLIVTLAVEYTR